MFYILSWVLVGTLLGLWSLAAWAFHGLGLWTASLVGSQAAGVEGLPELAKQVPSLPVPAWAEPWLSLLGLPDLAGAMASLGPWLSAILSSVPVLAEWLTPLVWLVWGLGALLLLILGGGLSLLVKVLHKAAAVPAAGRPA